MIYDLRALESLSINNNNLYQLFSGISKLTNLRSLHLHRGYLLFIADDFSELNLSNCVMSFNPLKKLPDFTKMKNLVHLAISGLPELEEPEKQVEQLAQVESLKELSTQGTEVLDIFTKLKYLPQLNRINIGHPSFSTEQTAALKADMSPITVWVQHYKNQ
jgi:Leucine-rich repeat (LRR) protein